MRRLVWLAALALGGCTASLGPVGALAPAPDTVSTKLLRPDVIGRACRATVLGIPVSGEAPALRAALGQILALDAEGNVVTDAEVRWERFLTGVYNRDCLVVRGNLARTVSSITLPAPAGHEGHHPR